MTNDELKGFEEQLIVLRDKLSHQITEVIKDTEMGEDIDHFEEEADEAEERGAAYATQTTLKGHLAAVLDALHKIKIGIYGTCDACKKPIEAKVLGADPASRYCKPCKAHKA